MFKRIDHIELVTADPREEHLGYRMMALEVESMDKAIDYLAARGVKVVWGPITRPAYARADICDPDGNHIELRHWVR